MPIDPSIALNIRPVQLPNPLEQFGQFQQARAAMGQNRLADLVLGEKQREASENALMNRVYKSATSADGRLDRNMLLGSVAAEGLGSRIPSLQKSFQELDKGAAEIAHKQADTAKASAGADKDRYETLLKQTGAISSTLGALRGMQGVTPQYVASALQHLGDIGVIPKEHLAGSLAQIPQDPAQLPAWLEQKQAATMSTIDQMRFTRPDANTIATNATSRANNVATVGATIRGQDMTDARQREANVNSRGLMNEERQLRIDALRGKAEDRKLSKEATAASLRSQIGVIDKALDHPGRATATGLSGTLDPRNFLPGSDATDFRVVADQLGGGAFLQAFESLKGAGQITEIEGQKATAAIARLNRAQSDDEYETALHDLRDIINSGLKRSGAMPAPERSRAGTPAAPVQAGVKFLGFE